MIEERGVDDWLRQMRRRDSTLDQATEALLRGVLSSVIELPSDQDIVREHDRPSSSHLLLEGWAGRYVTLADGRRQIVALHTPGDFVDLHSFPLRVMDHAVATFTPCRIALAPHERLHALSQTAPHATRLLWMSTLIDAAIHRQWLVGAGKRSALENTAHLFCELLARLQLSGRAEAQSFSFPLSQAELADCLGVSAVHANRVLQELRAKGLVDWRGQRLEIQDVDGLKRLAEFDDVYLNLIDSPR